MKDRPKKGRASSGPGRTLHSHHHGEKVCPAMTIVDMCVELSVFLKG